MKTHIVATVAAVLFSTVLFAQKMTYDAGRTTFGVRAGVNFGNVTGKFSDGTKLDNGIAAGFHAGVNAEVPLGSGMYLQPGVLYSQKGAELKMIPNSQTLKLNYLEVPVNFVYKPILGTGRLLLGFGPYVGYGISGKYGDTRDVVFTKEYKDGATTPSAAQYQHLDYGGNLLAGYEFKNNVSLQFNAQLGLANITPNTNGNDNRTRQNNTGFGLSAGYRF